MKRIALPVLLAVIGLVVAGCASGHIGASKAAHALITVTGPETIPHVTAGTPIRCQGGPTVSVPAGAARIGTLGAGHWSQSPAPQGPVPATNLQLSRSANGTITVACTRS